MGNKAVDWTPKIRELISCGEITMFWEIFYGRQPVTQLCRKFGFDFVSLQKKIKNPEKFTIREVRQLARFFEVSEETLHGLIIAQYRRVRPKKVCYNVPVRVYPERYKSMRRGAVNC